VSLDPAPGTIAAVFVALADPSRRQVIGVLAARGTATATAVAEELAITRQAVAKHLATLSDAGLVDAERAGREVRYRLRPAPLRLAARWLDTAAGAWDDRLATVKDAAERRGKASRDRAGETSGRLLGRGHRLPG
jgi:DNA-binding transcriptional ArsR family regulator